MTFYAQSIVDLLDDYLTSDELDELRPKIEKAVGRIVDSARSDGFTLGYDEALAGSW